MGAPAASSCSIAANQAGVVAIAQETTSNVVLFNDSFVPMRVPRLSIKTYVIIDQAARIHAAAV